MYKMFRIAVVSLISILLCGCGLLSTSYPPFKNLTDVQKVNPITQFDPKTADAQLYEHVKVYQDNGKQVTLNATRHPLLFVAYWCPHCQRTLVALEKQRAQLGELPMVVNMGFQPGSSLEKAKLIEHQEIHALGLKSMKFYYVLHDSNEQKYIPNGFPTLVFSKGKQMLSLSGEHEFHVWQTALNRS